MSPVHAYRGLDSGTKRIVQVGAIAILACVMAVALGLVVAFGADSKSDTGISLAHQIDETNTDVFCPIWQQGVEASKAFAPGQKVTESGLKLYALFWNAYDRQGCASKDGPLPKPPAQLAPYLPEHLR